MTTDLAKPVPELAVPETAHGDAQPHEELLIDRLMPIPDARLTVSTVVNASPLRTYADAVELDFLTVHSPLLDAAMFARGVPDRIAAVRGRRTEPTVPTRLTLGDGSTTLGLEGWMKLGERPGCEIDFGAIGRFWTPTIVWAPADPEGFASAADPGWGKIACAFVVHPYGERRAVLTYECRTQVPDEESRRRFLRYWAVIRPFVRHIMRATIATIAGTASTADLLDSG